MPHIKISRNTVKAIRLPTGKPEIHWDEDLAGFGVLVRPNGAKTWIVQYRPGAGGRGTNVRRVKLGPVDDAMKAEQARGAAKDLLADVRKGADPAAKRKAERKADTVAELAERWFTEHVQTKRKAGTAMFYRHVLDTHVLPALGGRKAIAVTKQDVARLHSEVAGKRQGATKAGAKRSPKEKTRGGRVVANRALAVTAAMFTWGITLGLLPAGFVNPAKGVEAFKEEGRERFLSAGELARLGEALRLAETEGLPWTADETKPTAKHAPKPENRRVKFTAHVVAAFRLLLLTGARLREILHLEWRHVDWERGLLRLPDSKTGKKTIMLGGAALAVLEGLPRFGRYVIAGESAGTEDEAPRRDLNRPWRAVRQAAGLPDLRIHDLRHVFGGTGADSGLSLHQVGGLLGHSQARTTQRYAHLAADPQRRAADLIADKLASAIGMPGAESVSLDDRRRKA